MMYVKQLWTLLLLFTVGICGAQNGILNGTVSDEDGEPIIHAQVIADQSLGLTTVTDFDGFYSLELPSGVYSVVFEYLGMSTDSVEVSIIANETLTQDFMLREESTLINTIVVSASKYEKKLSEETVSIEVVGSDLLENNNIVDAEESLRKVPGVSIVDGQANIRGGSGW
ncbi:MAG: carboxypeptidase regulatory-like domain-containing protein, partial [Bacteroidota bacterium]|nr:carboxypeptidase regulatory-like domain-containing protein [Bacteroidota bacterium]